MPTSNPLKSRLFEVKAGAPAYLINAAADEVAEITLYDEIGGWGISSDQFARDLSKVTAKTIRLRINSPGGSVFEGINIFNALRRHGARIEVHVDSLAASIASIIAMAGDEIHMAENAYMMVHNPWALAIGDAEEMLKMAEVLEKLQNTSAEIYAKRSGKTVEEAAAWMSEETWFTAEEAKSAGLADVIEETVPGPAAKFDLSQFAKAPAMAEPEQNDAEGQPEVPQDVAETVQNTAKLRMELALKERE